MESHHVVYRRKVENLLFNYPNARSVLFVRPVHRLAETDLHRLFGSFGLVSSITCKDDFATIFFYSEVERDNALVLDGVSTFQDSPLSVKKGSLQQCSKNLLVNSPALSVRRSITMLNHFIGFGRWSSHSANWDWFDLDGEKTVRVSINFCFNDDSLQVEGIGFAQSSHVSEQKIIANEDWRAEARAQNPFRLMQKVETDGTAIKCALDAARFHVFSQIQLCIEWENVSFDQAREHTNPIQTLVELLPTNVQRYNLPPCELP
mmetsp:Transcript_17886/g.29014  ORF Transcript_17886/g.29014 Transcript_17886/m.29014 type:complete len:262 (-) Transcript_17886:1873-2658(-)